MKMKKIEIPKIEIAWQITRGRKFYAFEKGGDYGQKWVYGVINFIPKVFGIYAHICINPIK